MKLILNESLISNKDSDIIEDTSVQAQPDYQIIDVTVIPDEDYYPTVQAILIDLDEDGTLVESDGNKLDINILSETVNQKTGYSNSLFEFESANHTITLSLVLQETDRRGVYKVEAYTTKGIKVFESNTYKPKYVIESYLNSLANEYLIDKPLKEGDYLFLKDMLKANGKRLVHYSNPGNERFDKDKIESVFDFSNRNGGCCDSFKYYNDYWVVDDIPEENKNDEVDLEESDRELNGTEDFEEEPIVDETTEDYSIEEFMTAQKLKDEVLNLNIDYSEWNNLSPEERKELVKPEMEKFVAKYRKEFDKDEKIFDLLQYELTDLNFHTEAGVMEDLYRGGKGNE